MTNIGERLAALLSAPPVQDDQPDAALGRLLASLTPLDIAQNVLREHQRDLIDMICQHVPGYGPH